MQRSWGRAHCALALFLLLEAGSAGEFAADGSSPPDTPAPRAERTDGGDAAPCFETESEHVLTDPLLSASDVRWSDRNELLVLSVCTGLFPVSLTDGLRVGAPVARRGDRRGELFVPNNLARSPGFWAAAAPMHVLYWQKDGSRLEQRDFASVLDLDAHGDRILVLGAQQDSDGWAPDGAVAWLGSVDDGLANLRTLQVAAAGAGARPYDACALMEVSTARFLDDGTAVVVPGVEEGVYRYDREGRLLRTWQSADLRFDPGCGLTDAERDHYSAHDPPRWTWVNRRRVVEDVVSLRDGPGVIVRTFEDGVARWRMMMLGKETIRTCDLPFTGATSHVLHADADGDRIVFLVSSKARRYFSCLKIDPVPEAYRDEEVRLIVARYRP